MTKEDELQALREENRMLKALVAQLLPLKEQLAQANARIKELEDRLAKDSRTSSKPPSSDGLARLPRRSPRPSEKPPGGQAGHAGHTLSMVEQPDDVVRHRPKGCCQCGQDLSAVPGSVAERRQVLDVPEIRLLAHEHQIEAVCCPHCHSISLGSFPTTVSAPVQYGPHLQALAIYLHQGQLLPTARTCQALAALCGCQSSEATLLQWSELAAERLAPTVERIADLIAASRLQHADETGIRVYGVLHWLHVNCTRVLTHLAWHESRGRQAMDDIGIWPRFSGRGMHDREAFYDGYDCAHSICGAHLLRDCTAVAQQEHQQWATQMQDFLLDLHDACQQWRLLHLRSVPAIERDDWVARYFEILAAGYAAQPPPPTSSPGKPKGRRKQSQAKNLLDALMARADQVLALLDDLRIPFTKGTVEGLFRWMTQCFERRLPNSSFGIHDAQAAAEAGGMTLEELECYFIRAIVDDYQPNWDGLRRQKRNILWEEAVRQTGVPQYLGAPDDLKLLLMKAQNRKQSRHAYRVHDRSRLSFQGNWYVSPGLLNRLAGREFEIYYDRRDVSVIYLFVDGSYVGEAYCPAFMGQRGSRMGGQSHA